MKAYITIIFDQFGHPNQPFWKALYDRLFKTQNFEFKVLASHYFEKPLGMAFDLKTSNKFQKLKFAIEYLLNPFSKKIDFKSYLKRPWLAMDKNDCVHLLNAQQYPDIKNYLKNKKLIFSFRGFETLVRPVHDEKWKLELINIYKEARMLHFVSDYIKNFAIHNLEAPSEKCIVIRRSVDVEFFKPNKNLNNKSNKIVITSIGRLTWQKGYIYSLKAISELVHAGKSIIYNIIGEGPDQEEILFHINNLGLQDHVVLHGSKNRSELKSVLNETDIYLHPSLSEALPNAILEASSMACAIVTTNAGGIPEAIDDNGGVMIEPCDSETLFEKLLFLVENDEARKTFGTNAREYMIKKFSPQRELDQWEKAYRIIGEK